MSSSKYIIGLGTNVPSTRILKPPGGDCSDLFGLRTRQKALMEYVKKRATAVENSKILDLINKAKAQNIFSENDLMNSNTSMSFLVKEDSHIDKQQTKDSCNEILSSNLKRSEGKENLLEIVHNSTNLEDRGFSPNYLKTSSKSPDTERKKPIKSNRNSVPSFKLKVEGCNFQDNSKVSPDKISSPKHNEAKKKNSAIARQKNQTSANIKSKLREKSNSTKEMSPIPPTETKHISEHLRTIIRNPITGTVTKVRGKGIWNKMEVIDDIVGSNFESKRRNQIYTPRNPITGEGTRDDSNYYKFVPRGIRVIQPPGGISCGIY